jgi:hypothetical protein
MKNTQTKLVEQGDKLTWRIIQFICLIIVAYISYNIK